MCDGPPTVFEKLRDAQADCSNAYLTSQDLIDLRTALGDRFDDVERLRVVEGNREGGLFSPLDVQNVIETFGDTFDEAEWQHVRDCGTEADRTRYAERTAVPPE